MNHRLLLLILGLGLSALWTSAGHLDDIGLTALRAELGASAPTGAGIGISQVEAELGTNYVADASTSELTGKTFTLKSGATSASSHATLVARNVCGSTNGVAPGVTQIDAYEANAWLGSNALRTLSSQPPLVESRRVQNHSWVGSTETESTDIDMLRRFDFAIARDGFLAAVAINNFTVNPLPVLLTHSYNSISVGQASGNHSAGLTTLDGAGRIKPEIVAPASDYATSYSCGVVSGAAALLLKTADAAPALVNARSNSEVIKALLLAGAVKSPYPAWNRTPTQPLDLVYGAGRLNIQNSYHLLVAGEQAPSSSVTVSNRGWDFATTTASPARYFFDVPAGFALTNFSVILTWNRKIIDPDGGSFNMQVSLANLDLRLRLATGFSPGAVVDSSVSTNQNIEHVFATLGPGRYALEVTNDTSGTDYTLAWGGSWLAQISTGVNQPTWGSVSPPSGNYPVGKPLSFAATPAPYFLFNGWTGNLTGTNNPVSVTINSNLAVTAVFAERYTTNYPTPYWWLAQYGYTSNQESAVTNVGANGFPLWQSYQAGLVPTNPASQLRFTSVSLPTPTSLILTWDTVTGRVYSVWAGADVLGGFGILPGASNLPATTTSFTNIINSGVPKTFYRLEAKKL